MRNYCILVVSVLLVHTIKATRLYLALYGADISRAKFLETYCLATPVSLLVPFKLGELFRMYSYGRLLGDYMKGIIIILLDRFMDTLALVTIILIGVVFFNTGMTPLAWFFVGFLLLLSIVYMVFPGTARYWKKLFITLDASPGKIKILEKIELSTNIYHEIEEVCRGRGVLLYGLSLLAWSIELCGLLLQSGRAFMNIQLMNRYLFAAIGGASLDELRRFVIVSVALLLLVLVILVFSNYINKRLNERGC